MNQEIKNLLVIYEHKMASFWQLDLVIYENKMVSFWRLDGEMQWCEDDRIYRMEQRQRVLDGEVKEARANLVAAIEKLEID
jgi:hypothetical protein